MNAATHAPHSPYLPYAGIRVVDMSQGIAGPSCGSLLARQGADVIKIEPPSGDWGRLMGRGENGLTAISIGTNVGKRALCVDASGQQGQALLRRLIDSADVLLDSFRPGVMVSLGLGYDTLAARNPRLVHLSITGYGSSGPYREKPGSDSVLQALSGMMAMNAGADGAPRRIGMLMIDAASGVYAAQSVGAALVARSVTGQGARVEVSLLEVAASLQTIPILDHYMGRGEAHLPVTVPSGTFATLDGFINVVTLRNEMFFRLGNALGHPEWTTRKAWSTNEKRLKHAGEINAEIRAALATRATAYWVERLAAHDVLCAAVNGYEDFVEDEQVQHAGLFRWWRPGSGAPLPVAGVPGVPGGGLGQVPRHAEHSREVLRDWLIPEAEIEALLAQGVAQQAECPTAQHERV
jgi:crotonobetainyl-CoA:carnitine CoA-transferase CaiB-like acyl-CoA transferase